MNVKSFILLALLAGLVTAAFADGQLSKVDGGNKDDKKQNEAGQRSGGNSGPDSWQFWGPNRQLLADPKPEAGQHTNFGPDGYQAWTKNNEAGQKTQGGASGPDSWQFWGPNRQLLDEDTMGEEQVEAQNEAGQRSGGNSGPDSWQFWAPNRQLLADPKPEAGQHTNFGPDGYQAWAKKNEAGQKTQGGASGPDSWQFWAPNRQLLGTGTVGRPEPKKTVNEAGQRSGGNSGPDSWQFWAPNRQLLADPKPEAGQHTNFGPDGYQAWAKKNEAGQKTQGGASGPDSWQFWGPNRQLLESAQLNKPVVNPQKTAAAPAKKPEAAPKPVAAKPQQQAPAKKPESAPKQAAAAPTKKPEAAPKPAAVKPQQAAPAKQPEAAPKQQAPQQQAPQQQAPQKQNERGFRGWGWGGNADIAGMPGGGQAYPLMNVRNIYTAAGWGGAPTTCAQGEFAHACSTRKLLRKFLFRL